MRIKQNRLRKEKIHKNKNTKILFSFHGLIKKGKKLKIKLIIIIKLLPVFNLQKQLLIISSKEQGHVTKYLKEIQALIHMLERFSIFMLDKMNMNQDSVSDINLL